MTWLLLLCVWCWFNFGIKKKLKQENKITYYTSIGSNYATYELRWLNQTEYLQIKTFEREKNKNKNHLIDFEYISC